MPSNTASNTVFEEKMHLKNNQLYSKCETKISYLNFIFSSYNENLRTAVKNKLDRNQCKNQSASKHAASQIAERQMSQPP